MLGMQEKTINNHNTSDKKMEALLSTITVATSRSHDPSMVPTLKYGLGHESLKKIESFYSLNTTTNAIMGL